MLAACGENRTPAGGVDGGEVVLDCLPDLDGRLDEAEMPTGLGVTGEYFRSGDGTAVDLAGTVDEDGRRQWDLGGETGSERITVTPAGLAGRWYAASFPGGELVLPAGELEAVYARDADALWLLGLASVEPDPPAGRTLLVYQPPVAVLRFPIEPGRSWTEVCTITGGRLDGLPYNGTDTYEVESDAAGRVLVPYVSFEQAHRVRTQVTVVPAAGGVTTSRRQVSFVSECFGEIARAVSRPDEPQRDFTVAAELLRFAL